MSDAAMATAPAGGAHEAQAGADLHHHDEEHTEGIYTIAPLVVSLGLAVAATSLVLRSPLIFLGMGIFSYGAWLWLREYLPTRADEHPVVSTHAPFAGIEVRKVGIWLFLMTEMMVFSSLVSTYVRYRLEAGADWVPAASHQDLFLGSLNTFILLSSSFTLATALDAARHGKQQRMMYGLVITLMCGVAFLLIKAVEWYEMIYLEPEPFTPWGSVEGTTFYVTTGTHGGHVLGGVIVLGYLIYKGANRGWGPTNSNSIEYFGLYWHFVDIIWALPVFPFFYLI